MASPAPTPEAIELKISSPVEYRFFLVTYSRRFASLICCFFATLSALERETSFPLFFCSSFCCFNWFLPV